MGHARIQTQIVPDSQFPEHIDLLLSHSLAHRLQIDAKTIWIHYGSALSKASLALVSSPSTLIRISVTFAQKLNLDELTQINAQFDPSSLRLQLGPLLGIMINTKPNERNPHFFGEMTRFLDECVKAGQSSGIQTFVFSPEKINLDQKVIHGWSKQKGKWVSHTYPLPNVIYNRITSRRVEEKTSLQNRLSQLRNLAQTHIFNEKFLDKWEVHQILRNDPDINHMLPTTHLYHILTLQKMFNHYPVLFLKPVNGSLGNGIIRLIQSPKEYLFQSTSTQGTVTIRSKSKKRCLERVARRIGKQRYLIQRGLSLVKFENRPIDFRILVQKNNQGEWSVTSAVGRIARSEQFVSNLARGGTVLTASEVLKRFNVPNKPNLAKLHEIALKIAHRFDHLASGHFAELGIDLALDGKGKVWLIEMNSKPSKTDSSVINHTNGVRPSVNNLVGYICFLTGIKKKRQAPTRKPKRRMKNNE